MDELNIKLSTKIMRNMVAKIMSKKLSKAIGCNIDIQLSEMEVKTYDGKVHIHMNVNAESTNEDILKLLKTIG